MRTTFGICRMRPRIGNNTRIQIYNMKNSNFLNLLGSAYFFILGFILFCFHKKLGAKAVEFQVRWFNKLGRSKKFNQYGYLFVGIIFMIFGVLMLLRKGM